MKKWIGLSFIMLSACAAEQASFSSNNEPTIAGITFVEKVNAEEGKTVIPYSKYVLDNGLTVILHEDDSDPLVHVDVTYHVGSSREELGKSGFAHFFEHMMFQGSEHVADEQHFKLVTEAGGKINGTTNSDRTNYYQTVPANQLEKMLWLESDRMGFLLGAVTQEKFEVQRETVKNERGQRIDNKPYGLVGERVAEALYPANHPYSWQTIGYVEDLNRVNVNDLKDFFLRWYGPNNATLTIGGDIDKTETLVFIKKYFGDISRGPEVLKPTAPDFSLDKDRYITLEDNVHLPLIYITYPTVNGQHEDEAPLSILSTILGGGKTSLFYKNLVKKQIAVQAKVSHACQELACNFSLLALPHPKSGKSLTDVEKIISETLVEFENRGVEDDDLIKAKATMEARFIFGLQSVIGKVNQLAASETFTDSPNYIEKDIARYNAVTKADIMRVYHQYIKNKHAVILSVVPKGKLNMVAAKSNFKPAQRKFTEVSSTSVSNLLLRPSKESFDRNVMPIANANKAVDVPTYNRSKLANGIDVLTTQSTETPTTIVRLKIPAGHYYENKEKAGLASVLANMLNESTKQRSSENMSKALQKLGSSISIKASNQYINVTINSLTKNTDATLALALEKMLQPAFVNNEFKRIKRNKIQGLLHAKKNASGLAKEAYRKITQADNIGAYPVSGSIETLKNITLADVKAFYQKQFKPSGAKLISASNSTNKKLITSLNVFEQWQGVGKKLELTLPIPEYKTGVIYLVNKDNAPQSVIRIGKRSITHDITGEFYRTNLMNFTLGGAFNSRLNLNLREDKGYTYGARSGFWADPIFGDFSATAEVRADVTDKALVEMVSEINVYAEKGVHDDELAFMRKAINQQDALKYETPRAKMGYLGQILEYDLTPNFVEKRNKIVETISKEEINQLASKHLNVKDMIIVIVGDAKTLKPQLTLLGYNIIDYQLD